MRSKTRHSRAGPNMNNVYTRPTQSAANEPAPKPAACGRAASRTWRRNRPNSASSPSPKSLNWKGLRAKQLDKTLLALGGTGCILEPIGARDTQIAGRKLRRGDTDICLPAFEARIQNAPP